MLRVLVLLVFSIPAFAGGKVDSQMIAPYVEIRTDSCIGSGVVIDWHGSQMVLTAKHVVDGAKRVVLVKRHDDDELETKWNADVVAMGDGEADLALLKPRTAIGLKSANLCFGVKLERGEDAWYVGSHTGLHAMLEKSVVNRPSYRLKDQWNDRKYTFFNGNAWYGNSGGPAFVKRGDNYFLAGIIVRLAVINERTPIAAERLEAINAFLINVNFEKKECDECEKCCKVAIPKDREQELKEKVEALVRLKFNGSFRKAFDYYAGKDELVNRRELIFFLEEAKVGNIITRGVWADEIMSMADLDRSGQLTWGEVQALKKRGWVR